MDERTGVSVVIPTFNEAGPLGGDPRTSQARWARLSWRTAAAPMGRRRRSGGRGGCAGCRTWLWAGLPGWGGFARGSVVVFLDGDGADRGDLLGLIAGRSCGNIGFVLASRTRGRRDPDRCCGTRCWPGGLPGGASARCTVRYSDMCAYRAIGREVVAAAGHAGDDVWLEHRDANESRACRAAHRRGSAAVSLSCRRAFQGRWIVARHAARRRSDRGYLRSGGSPEAGSIRVCVGRLTTCRRRRTLPARRKI